VLARCVLYFTSARELVGLLPVIGLVPMGGSPYAGTRAIGRALVASTTEGRQVTAVVIARYSRESMAKGRAMAGRLTSEQVPGARRSRLDRWTQFLPLPRRRLKQN